MSNILIKNGAVLTANGWIDLGFVWIENDVIQSIRAGDPPQELSNRADETLNARHCAVLPGLLNGHTHLSQTFMRGLAGGRSLIDWLKDVIWPIQNVISPEEMHLAALLGLVENLRGGATEVVDHHKITSSPAHTDAVLLAAQEVGLRFILARAWSDKGKNPEDPVRILADLDRLFTQTTGSDRLNIANGPLALWRCTAGTLQATRKLALEHGALTHFHVSESRDEVGMSLDEYGLRPVKWLESIGVLGPDTQLVHSVWVEADEIETIRRFNAPVVHCPVSNAVLGSGVAPLAKMLQHGIEVRLGTDGPASNDTQDLWETLKAAVSFARATTLDPTVLPPAQALRLATGGKTLQVGGRSDVIIVSLDHPRVVPVQDVDSALVLGTNAGDVETVIVGGKILMQDKCLKIIDENALLEESRVAIQGLRKRAGLDR